MLTKHNKISQNFQVSVFPKNHDKLVLFALFVFNCLKWNYGHQDDMTRFFSIHKKHHEDHETKQKFFNSTKTLWIFLPCKKKTDWRRNNVFKKPKKASKNRNYNQTTTKRSFLSSPNCWFDDFEEENHFLTCFTLFFTLFFRFLSFSLSFAHAN